MMPTRPAFRPREIMHTLPISNLMVSIGLPVSRSILIVSLTFRPKTDTKTNLRHERTRLFPVCSQNAVLCVPFKDCPIQLEFHVIWLEQSFVRLDNLKYCLPVTHIFSKPIPYVLKYSDSFQEKLLKYQDQTKTKIQGTQVELTTFSRYWF